MNALIEKVNNLRNALIDIYGEERSTNILLTLFTKEFTSENVENIEKRNSLLDIISFICNRKGEDNDIAKPSINIEKVIDDPTTYVYCGPVVRGTDLTGKPYKSRGNQNKCLTGELEVNGMHHITKYEKIQYGTNKLVKVTFDAQEKSGAFNLSNYYPMDREVVKKLFPVTYRYVWKIIDHVEHHK